MLTKQFTMRSDPAFEADLDDYRSAHRRVLTRAEALRVLAKEAAERVRAGSPETPSPSPAPEAKPAESSWAAGKHAAKLEALARSEGLAWNRQRPLVRQAFSSHPEWAAYKAQHPGLKLEGLSDKTEHCAPIAKALGITLPSTKPRKTA